MTMSQGINDEYPLTREFLYEPDRHRPHARPVPTFPLQPRGQA
jgi:hypothetical protein